jgi:hypothetical protein
MIKLDEIKKDYELEWLRAERNLAILEYENYKWLHPAPDKEEKK